MRIADPTRVVSLVPSLTEAIETTAPGVVIGATDWCVEPSGLDVARVGGTKSPRVPDVLALGPDVVVANEEENRATDIAALRDHGVAVWVTAPRTLEQAIRSLDRTLRLACGLDRPDWLDDVEQVWRVPHVGPRRRAVVPIWRRPWMALGCDTFAGDVLSRLGVDGVLSAGSERYPRVELGEVRRLSPDLVVLPDEPYDFGWADGPEAFAGWDIDVACVSGRHLTWYGPSLVSARDILSRQLGEVRHS